MYTASILFGAAKGEGCCVVGEGTRTDDGIETGMRRPAEGMGVSGLTRRRTTTRTLMAKCDLQMNALKVRLIENLVASK